jgi:hypothetical protein
LIRKKPKFPSTLKEGRLHGGINRKQISSVASLKYVLQSLQIYSAYQPSISSTIPENLKYGTTSVIKDTKNKIGKERDT